jgi:protein-L-isoaspartate O-methyltransferase
MGELTPPAEQAVQALAGALAKNLKEQGLLTQPDWARALKEVPRHLFIPERAWAKPDRHSEAGYRIDLGGDPSVWWAAAYSDSSVVIQADDGAGDPASGQGSYSSSVSAPGVVFSFLELLRPDRDDRVLDIGTGSGWTAALLSWWVGQGNVTSIEVDAGVAAQAEDNLTKAGFTPNLIIGDGTKGCPDRAPFDRIHVTAGVRHIPTAWIEQTRPGGVIVLPWQPGGAIGHKLRLSVLNEATAVGSFHGAASYMMVRSQREENTWQSHHEGDAETTTTRLSPRAVVRADLGAYLLGAALAPRIGWYPVSDSASYSLLLSDLDDPSGSWATCDMESGANDYQVTQYGSRRLWDEVATAYLQWISIGSPSCDRFGLNLTADESRLWLGDPTGPSWQLPT